MSFSVLRALAAAAIWFVTIGGGAAQNTSVRFSLDSKLEGPTAPFAVAIDRGYYRAEGLEVTVDAAMGPTEALNRVAAGNYDLAFTDINTLMKFRDANPQAPVKAVFVVYSRPPYAIIARKSRSVTTPKDLEGKRLGAPAADVAYAQWPVFAQANGIDASKVTIENIGFPVREPMLAAGQLDAITGISYWSYINLKERGVPADDIVVLLMADYGVNLYGNAIVVNTKFAAEKPEAVRGFLRAFVKALKDTVRDPAAAVDSVIKRVEGTRKEVELERLQMALRDNILTAEAKANGFGGFDPTRLERSIDQIGLTYNFRVKPKAADIFDPQFLPPVADRAAQ